MEIALSSTYLHWASHLGEPLRCESRHIDKDICGMWKMLAIISRRWYWFLLLTLYFFPERCPRVHYRRDYAEEISLVFRSKLRNERQASRCTTFIIRKVLKLHFQSPSFEVKVEWGSDFYLDEFFLTDEIPYLHFPLHTKRKKAGNEKKFLLKNRWLTQTSDFSFTRNFSSEFIIKMVTSER